jgi:hypothetical protein
MGRTDFIVFFIIVSTLLLGLPVIVLLFLPNFCVHELALEDTNKKKMILTNKLGFVRPRFILCK